MEVAEQVSQREKVQRLEDEMQAMPQAHCPVRHMFAHGIYCREMTIPAGVAATGAVHKTDHITMIVRGRVSILSEHGAQEYTAPATIMSRAGSKKAAYAHEDTVLITIHATHETDLDKLVMELTESKPQELLGGSENKQCIANRIKG